MSSKPVCCTDGPDDPYNDSEAVHVDELPEFNGDSKASFAYDDDGTRYKVRSGEGYPETYLLPEERWRENWMPERDGVGDPCAGCENAIEWNAIILRDDGEDYHLRCYEGGES